MTKRILVTGSRSWTDKIVIRNALMVEASRFAHEDIVLVHGANPRGADAIADKIATQYGWVVEKHPAKWSSGRSAGPIRNQQMADAGADVCLAFPLSDSKGTFDMIDRARDAGIELKIFMPSDIAHV